MQHYEEKDVTIITFFNKFSAFNEEENAADLSAAGHNFMKLAKYLSGDVVTMMLDTGYFCRSAIY